MHQRIVAAISLLYIGSVVVAVGVLAYLNRQAAVESFHQRHDALVKFATSNVELGVTTGRIDVVEQFLADLASNPLFAGAVIYDSDKDGIMQVPSGFELPAAQEEEILKTGDLTTSSHAYQIAELQDAGETLGYFLLATSFETLNAQRRRALAVTAAVGLLLLLPVTALIAWLLAWLEKNLRAREIRLKEVNTENEAMLNNLDQGVFTFNTRGVVHPQHSKRAQELFNLSDSQTPPLQHVLEADDETFATFVQWVSMISESRFLKDWQRFEGLNPVPEIARVVNDKKQTIVMRYRPIVENAELQRIMVLGSDITAEREAQEALADATCEQQANMERILALVHNDAMTNSVLQRDVEKVLDLLVTADARDVDYGRLYRDLHTIKGNAGSAGYESLAIIAGKLEDVVVTVRNEDGKNVRDVDHALLAELREELEKIAKLRSRLFSERRNVMAIDPTEYHRLLDDVTSGTLNRPIDVRRRIIALNAQPFSSYCKKYQRIIDIYRRKHGKDIADLHIDTPDRRVNRTLMTALDSCIVHLIRNAVDHGIESDEERQAKNKGPGVIRIGVEVSDRAARVTVADDGAGIDPDAIATAAVARGVITSAAVTSLSYEQRLHLVLQHGFSTKDRVTDISGRGVGLDAVKTAIEALGGEIGLDSRVGRGLTVTLTMPAEPLSLTTNNEPTRSTQDGAHFSRR